MKMVTLRDYDTMSCEAEIVLHDPHVSKNSTKMITICDYDTTCFAAENLIREICKTNTRFNLDQLQKKNIGESERIFKFASEIVCNKPDKVYVLRRRGCSLRLIISFHVHTSSNYSTNGKSNFIANVGRLPDHIIMSDGQMKIPKSCLSCQMNAFFLS